MLSLLVVIGTCALKVRQHCYNKNQRAGYSHPHTYKPHHLRYRMARSSGLIGIPAMQHLRTQCNTMPSCKTANRKPSLHTPRASIQPDIQELSSLHQSNPPLRIPTEHIIHSYRSSTQRHASSHGAWHPRGGTGCTPYHTLYTPSCHHHRR